FTFLRFLFYATRTSAFTSLPYTTLFRSALGPGRRELARQEVVAGVPVLDVDHVARLAETSDLVREDQLCHVCRPFSARRRRVRQQGHLAGVLDGASDRALLLDRHTRDATG